MPHRPTRMELAKVLCNAWNLSTLAGFVIAWMGRAHIRSGPAGLWLAEGYRWGFPIASAFTVGNVLITSSDFDRLGAGVLQHETVHSWQYMRWGWLFGPAYLLAMAWSWITTGDRAARNHFETAAGLADGGYREVGLREIFRRTR